MWLGELRGKHRTQKLLAVATEFSLLLKLPSTDLKHPPFCPQMPVEGFLLVSGEEGIREESDCRDLVNVLVNEFECGEHCSIFSVISYYYLVANK